MKFGWLADTHLDTMQYGLERRREDFALAFEFALGDMINKGIHVAIHSGDIINSNRPGPGTIQRLQAINQWLIAKDFVLYVVKGNHDLSDPHWIDALHNPIPDRGIKLLNFKKVAHADNNGVLVSFYGVPFMSPQAFRAHRFEPATVLVMHQQVTEFADFPTEDTLKIADLPKGYRLIAIGDIHVHNILARPEEQDCLVGYPGSTELKSETESGVKYWVECEADGRPRMNLTAHMIKTRPVIRVTINDDQDPNATINAVEMVRKEINPAEDPREPIIFITYLNTIQGVMEQFKTAFNPNNYILRFKPIFGEILNRSALEEGISEAQEMTIDEILRSQMMEIPKLFGIASQLVNQDVDPNAALDEFIEGELRAIEAASQPANV